MIRTIARCLMAWLEAFDRWQQRRPAVAFFLSVIRKYQDDEASLRAALLAYFGFLSLFPLLLVLTTVFGILLHSGKYVTSQILRSAVAYFPLVGNDLQRNIHTLGSTGLALFIGIALTLFGARGVADVLRSSLDHIWLVPFNKRSKMPGALVRSIAMLVVGGLGLAVTPVAFGYILAFAPNRVVGVVSGLLTAGVLYWVLVFIIKVGTSTPQPLKRIWVGTLVAVISLGTLQSAGGYVMAVTLHHLDSLYGTFALVLGLMFWLYLQAQLLLFAFEVDSVRAFKLSPRSLQPPLTPADDTAFVLYHDRARFHDLP
jgi:YihY family inner membrane protein